MWTANLITIKDILAKLFYERDPITTIVLEAGLPPENINWNGAATEIWRYVITEAVNRGKLHSLIKACIKNSGSPDLPTLYDEYLKDLQQPPFAESDYTGLRIKPKLIGRQKEIEEFTDLLRQSEVQLLTLTGPSGVGKTALAKYLAVDLAAHFKDGVFFVSLASASEHSSLWIEIGNAMPDYKRTVGVSLIHFLRDKHRLIVLDNFDTVINAAPFVTTIIGNCTHVKIIATSQQPLATRDRDLQLLEHRGSLSPLSYPGASGYANVAPAETAAVQLFIARAEVIKGKGHLPFTPENMEAIAAICRKVNGLPLCIQIVASFISSLDPPELYHFLEDHGFAELDEEQQLNRAIKIRYANLTSQEQTLFRRLAVFGGRCSFEAIKKVCGSVAGRPVPLLATLRWLVDKSFLQFEGGRYHMLQVIRDFALEQLEATDEADDLRQKYAEYYLTVARNAAPELKTRHRKKQLQQLEQDYDNFRAVFNWSISPSGRLDVGLSLVGALFWYWNFLAYFREGRRKAQRILNLAGSEDPSLALASARYCDGGLAFLLGEYPEAEKQLSKSVEVWRTVRDKSGLAYALIILGMVKKEIGKDLVAARDHEEESVRLMESLKDDWGHALALNDLANVMVAQGKDHYGEARRCYEESRRKWEDLKEPWGLSLVLSNLSSLDCKDGQYDSAYNLMNDALKIQDQENDKWGRAWSLKGLGEARLGKTDYANAACYFYKSFCLHADLGRKQLVAECLEGLAKVAAGVDEANLGAYLSGAAERLRGEAGTINYYANDKEYEDLLKKLRDNLSPRDFDRARAEGRVVIPEELQRQVHSFVRGIEIRT